MEFDKEFSQLSTEYIEGRISKEDYESATKKMFADVPLSTKPKQYTEKISDYLGGRIGISEFQRWYLDSIKTERAFIEEPLISILYELFNALLDYSPYPIEYGKNSKQKYISEDEVKAQATSTLDQLNELLVSDNNTPE
ncbi:MAG: hypothetical protein DWQ07_07965 [Chloroflexi bacterium]|nr:MAG: hypothetical protein DWQ07_07965 [Chloroflexota bacterium]MBL1197026.1 hypothetical protein [Chloroflexota bacterium]NOH14320.1 hypothetical protein [Chloroflexota bacterium]